MREAWKVYKNVFSQFSLANIFKLSTEGYFKELESPLFIGKESNVMTALTKDNERVIVKIYRLENCNFNRMYSYIKADQRYIHLKKSKREIVFAWTQREYRNLLMAQEVIAVPKPIALKYNIIVMSVVGNDGPAPPLKNAFPKNPKAFFDEIVLTMKKLYHHGLVHGDLSEYNILNDKEKPVFIDFSQSTTTKSPNHVELLQRDIHNIVSFFKNNADEELLLKEIKK
ncbi:serine protein kinase RIO [Candidatus Woesearchaeota archaeon]|nr:MAG: serine protein kinase RIO [Candidatus Woesearchaeota archaeon]